MQGALLKLFMPVSIWEFKGFHDDGFRVQEMGLYIFVTILGQIGVLVIRSPEERYWLGSPVTPLIIKGTLFPAGSTRQGRPQTIKGKRAVLGNPKTLNPVHS